jgi:hypothetical protein
MACAICQTRRPRRFCPGVQGEICSLCCGTAREVSVDCPLDCDYLREAHKHEKAPLLDPQTLPNRDLQFTQEALEEHQELLAYLAHALGRAALANPAVVDFDIREALAATIRTHRTSQSGLVYESLPDNPLAAGICRAMDVSIEEFRRAEAEESGVHKTRESTILGLLVFLQHFELAYNNGRRRGRAFLGGLLDYYSVEPPAATPSASSLILP